VIEGEVGGGEQKEDVEVEEDCVEWKYFEKFEEEIGQNLEPYRTEWMIWDKELKFAGSIDMIFRNPDGTLLIYDWKRCRQIKMDNKWQSSTNPIFSELPDTNFWHYSLQLNIYKYLLEKNYKKKYIIIIGEKYVKLGSNRRGRK
jgi:ATP-dependent exoDNAse (exonuclease V) beta subunit